MKKILPLLLALLILGGGVFSIPASAQLNLINKNTKDKIRGNVAGFQESAGFEAATPDTAYEFVGTLINTALSLLGVAFLILLMYGGYSWLTAQGEEEGVTKAKKIITQAVIGLFIVLVSYAISWFVVAALQNQTLKNKAAMISHYAA